MAKILSFDYGQIEARVIAMFTKDPVYVKALWDGFDVHGDWARRIAADYPERIGGRKMLSDKKAMKDFRGDIKNQWTFPLIFGAKRSSVAGYLNIPEDVIAPHFEDFWDEFRETKVWQEKMLKFYRKYGYVECLTGRRRHGPLSLNMVFNTPVQGTAADIVCDGWCRLSETKDPELQFEIQVHDDLISLRVPDGRLEAVAEKAINILLDVPFDFVNVPLTIEMSVGRNWMPFDKTGNIDGMEEFGTFSSDSWFKKEAA